MLVSGVGESNATDFKTYTKCLPILKTKNSIQSIKWNMADLYCSYLMSLRKSNRTDWWLHGKGGQNECSRSKSTKLQL